MAGRGSGSGVAVEQTVWQATRFDHGKIVRFTGDGSRADAIEGEGLAGKALDGEPEALGACRQAGYWAGDVAGERGDCDALVRAGH